MSTLAWKIEVFAKADKSLRKLDRQVARKIVAALAELAELDDPRSRGKALTGNLVGLWRYRVGDYRLLCLIDDEVLVVLVVDVAHRSKVYR
uniref:type II toxin-antitoxin system RelE family toxin n=1 Tax=Vaginimicrobium propionicum TaxID=1871034 RepID=UPI001E4E1C09|nr:type II toxin-antitoxin system RelE/ParE family toxin [Vaginimicrobium propionicum]